MTIEAAKEERDKCEKEIKEIITNFETKTGLYVSNLQIYRADYGGIATEVSVHFEIKL